MLKQLNNLVPIGAIVANLFSDCNLGEVGFDLKQKRNGCRWSNPSLYLNFGLVGAGID
jgi:hypothetical protein